MREERYVLMSCWRQRLDRSLVPTGICSSTLGVGRGSFMVGNVEIFGVFLGVLPFPQTHFTNTLHFLFPSPLHKIIPDLVSYIQSGRGMRCVEAPIFEDFWITRMPTDLTWRTATNTNEMKRMRSVWWHGSNEICGRGKREEPREKPTHIQVRPPWKLHGVTEARTRDPSAEVGGEWLTAWATDTLSTTSCHILIYSCHLSPHSLLRKIVWFGVRAMYNHTGWWGWSGVRIMCSLIELWALVNIV